ncbi:unnamed protein product [Caenorhabditis nigoni]
MEGMNVAKDRATMDTLEIAPTRICKTEVRIVIKVSTIVETTTDTKQSQHGINGGITVDPEKEEILDTKMMNIVTSEIAMMAHEVPIEKAHQNENRRDDRNLGNGSTRQPENRIENSVLDL